MIQKLSLCALAARLDAREVSAREAMQSCLDRIGAIDEKVNAFISLDRDDALLPEAAAAVILHPVLGAVHEILGREQKMCTPQQR